ncbi:MAG TPA: molybdopterin-dependent oxidoreductase [Methanothrix sp.]|nr:molybdopterin-dependent oxidoreductase [Methanothrix sp.]
MQPSGPLDFLVVQEIFPTETTKYADVILPAASFAECDGTFTNGVRRIQRVRKAIPAICGLENWQTICRIAEKMGYPMDYSHPSEIMDEIATLAPMFAGVSYSRLGSRGLQWPCPSWNTRAQRQCMLRNSAGALENSTPCSTNPQPSRLMQIIH